ncbi:MULTISPECIES: DUF397 domain-containing protein [Actinoalloteichus]|uniref:DUF397 family protein n=1 Tax=Actinoalloteichus fjordicus TaxID=1612552 RepID=A0AAC9PR52_9PSEU|nr:MULTISPECIES: DUF397 domain-containing protein [Actinoalloteichus]APU13924.1 putative DUF397 family protein [Actinoalloteichus fjordicus]APU19870.1 putative DUF397 family protein [Actinoalloteichus sp. GBA129-24]
MTPNDVGQLGGWHKATASHSNGGCVEIGDAPGIVGIRDTKNRGGGTLVVDRPAFDSFLTSIKTDQLR